MICIDAAPDFAWYQPSVAHIRWDHRTVRWANNVARGKGDRRQIFIKADFIEGGTIGRVPSA
ncbi:MAG: hypothetical protein GWQ08_27685 [Verrucomicrobiaceae bacterium]|nr:hypothetical protein [Verrucomicrobiaceae bacterium]